MRLNELKGKKPKAPKKESPGTIEEQVAADIKRIEDAYANKNISADQRLAALEDLQNNLLDDMQVGLQALSDPDMYQSGSRMQRVITDKIPHDRLFIVIQSIYAAICLNFLSCSFKLFYEIYQAEHALAKVPCVFYITGYLTKLGSFCPSFHHMIHGIADIVIAPCRCNINIVSFLIILVCCKSIVCFGQ